MLATMSLSTASTQPKLCSQVQLLLLPHHSFIYTSSLSFPSSSLLLFSSLWYTFNIIICSSSLIFMYSFWSASIAPVDSLSSLVLLGFYFVLLVFCWVFFFSFCFLSNVFGPLERLLFLVHDGQSPSCKKSNT